MRNHCAIALKNNLGFHFSTDELTELSQMSKDSMYDANTRILSMSEDELEELVFKIVSDEKKYYMENCELAETREILSKKIEQIENLGDKLMVSIGSGIATITDMLGEKRYKNQ